MAYIALNQVEHYYEWICEGRPQTKPVVVFLHGWGGSARYWRSTAHAIKQDFDCLLYDLRGFGRSAPSPTADDISAIGSLESFAEDLLLLLDELSLTKVYLCAHSMGASVALYFLNRYPQRVSKAILTCNGCFEYARRAFKAFHTFGGYVVAFRPAWLGRIPLAPQVFMSRFLKQEIPYEDKRDFLQDFLKADHMTALGTLQASVSKHATETMPAAFSKLRVPTLLISGACDRITPAELGRKAAAMSPAIQYQEISQTGHFPMLEDRQTYLAAISDFLQA